MKKELTLEDKRTLLSVLSCLRIALLFVGCASFILIMELMSVERSCLRAILFTAGWMAMWLSAFSCIGLHRVIKEGHAEIQDAEE